MVKKTSSWTGNELASIKGMLSRIKEQIGFETLEKMQLPNDEDVKYGKIKPFTYYYVHYSNPLTRIGSPTPYKKKINNHEYVIMNLAPDSEDIIECIGISDADAKRIYLIGYYDNNTPPYLEYDRFKGWMLTVPTITYYPVETETVVKKFPHRYTDAVITKRYTNQVISKNAVTGITRRLYTILIKDLTDIRQQFEDYKENERRKEKQRQIEEEENRKRQEEYNRIRTTYTSIGYSSPGYNTIDDEKYNLVKNDPDSGGWKLLGQSDNTGTYFNYHYGSSTYYNDKYKWYYTCSYDSSD